MLIGILKRLFGLDGRDTGERSHPRKSTRKRGERLLNELAPVEAADDLSTPKAPSVSRSAETPAESSASFVCREPVLNRSGHMAAYEFMLRKYPKHKIRHETRAVLRLYDEVLIRNLIDMNIDRLLGNRLALIGIFSATLDCRLFESLPKHGVVLVIRNSAELIEIMSGDPISCIKDLKKQGFKIGLEDFSDAHEMAPFLRLADFAVIDVSVADTQQLGRRIELFSRHYPQVQLIARNVESTDAYEACRSLNFHLFQGPFLTRVEELDQPKVHANQMRLYELLNLVQKDAEVQDLVSVFKLDPMLTYKLLRYINSPGGGLINKVSTIEHAITVLGQKKLYRWLTLLLFSSGSVNSRDWALMENALVRGRLVEVFGREKFPPRESDDLFIVGFFSLLDVLLRMPMGQALAQLKLPDEVVQALVYRQGRYTPYLELAIACEQFNQDEIARLAVACGLDAQKANIFHVEAMIWAVEVEK